MACLASLVAALGLLACQGSDPQPLELVSLDRFGGAGSLVDGGGASSVVGFTSGGSGPPTVRLLRHDAADPDGVTLLGDVSLAMNGLVTRLRVTDEAAALIVGGVVWVVDPSDPSLAAAQVPAPASAADLAVRGRWVAVAVSRALFLVHRDAPDTTYVWTASSTPTALLATPGGFLAFTTTGYLVADLSGATPAFQEVSDPVLRNFRGGFADGPGAVVAGPGSAPDRTRVVRLDLGDPSAPVVVRSLEVAGAYVALAWGGGATSVIATRGPGDDARPEAFHEGYLVREAADGFHASGLPLAFWSQSRQPLAAHADRLFAVEAGGLAHLRLR